MAPTIQFYTDEHVAKAVVQGLRQRGVDVQTVSEAGLRGASDQDHLSWAYQHQRVLLTQDTDFLRLHASGLPHAGIVYAPQGTSVSEMVRGLMLIHQILKPEEMAGHVEFL